MDWLQIKLRSNLLCNRIVFASKLHSCFYSFQNTVDLVSRLSGRRKSVISTLSIKCKMISGKALLPGTYGSKEIKKLNLDSFMIKVVHMERL